MMNRNFSVGAWRGYLVILGWLLVACTVAATEEMTNTPVMSYTPAVQMEQTMTTKDVIPETTTDTAVTLQAQAQTQANTLVVTYQITNGLGQTIYLVNRLFQWTANGLSLDPNLIYAAREGESVRLVKACLPVPDDLDVESPIVPFLTAVSAGETFSETITLPLPLMPRDPYGQLLPGAQVTNDSSIQFVVGWFKEGDTAVSRQSQSDGSTLLSAEYDEVKQVQNLLQTTLSVQIPTTIQ
ncbi:MAG TPA: hypothetical protein PLD25_02505 [Chloroflexota bacterium]|nr:hypothetical protein [Chloroflexota bacterium]